MPTIAPITSADEREWRALWEGYLRFYASEVPAEVTEMTFARLVADGVLHGAMARDDDGRAVGIVHWLFHPATWRRGEYCYLEDLFVAPDLRRGGVGSALIGHVRDQARSAGAEKVYWLTQSENSTARRLYDAVATSTGFVHYEMEI
ncbi:GNAT family N-acetyltransferase [Microbacterium flavum]|uniref:GNAT family N-acetyltransferase n=1 Tax=Microbacterium flavum TaxID=415216 RepID=A0ABS5XU10_9MICO|nr:GNAT family N-acetyltransferase [Microbacterium flavum]MBT8797421.1 GNAT family N-acetyltransferase [Microbacterium flavum]